MSGKWSGPVVTAARAYWRSVMQGAEAGHHPLICSKCPKPVLSTQEWDVDHLLARIEGGSLFDRSNQWPAHSSCNRAAGAAITNSRPRRMRRWL